MTIQNLGSLADLIAAVATVIALLYLALQVGEFRDGYEDGFRTFLDRYLA